jgi:hypothetical protein
MMKKYKTFGELFEHFATLTKQNDKADLLVAHNTAPLQYFLHLAMQTEIAWKLPEGAPPYKADRAVVGYSPSHLFREMRSVYLFLDLPDVQLQQTRREQLFQQMLERLHPTEAELLIAVKDRTFMTKYKCPKAIITKAFPHLALMTFRGRLFTG